MGERIFGRGVVGTRRRIMHVRRYCKTAYKRCRQVRLVQGSIHQWGGSRAGLVPNSLEALQTGRERAKQAR